MLNRHDLPIDSRQVKTNRSTLADGTTVKIRLGKVKCLGGSNPREFSGGWPLEQIGIDVRQIGQLHRTR